MPRDRYSHSRNLHMLAFPPCIDPIRARDLHGGIFSFSHQSTGLVAFDSLLFQVHQAHLQPLKVGLQPLILDLKFRGLLCDAKFLGVELNDLARVSSTVMAGKDLSVL